LGQLFGGNLVAELTDRLRRGSDEDDAVFLARASEVRVLGQKTEARVQGIGSGRQRATKIVVDVEVTVLEARSADANGLVGQPIGHCLHVRLGVQQYRFNSQLLTGANNTDGHLAAVGDGQPVEQSRH
jgi:cyanophycinase-like exopeptidase